MPDKPEESHGVAEQEPEEAQTSPTQNEGAKLWVTAPPGEPAASQSSRAVRIGLAPPSGRMRVKKCKKDQAYEGMMKNRTQVIFFFLINFCYCSFVSSLSLY